MNFLGLAAVLSAVGMYALATYVRHAKTAEAASSLNSLAKAAADYYNTSDATQPVGATPEAVHAMRHFPPSARVPVPEDDKSLRGQRYQSSQAEWLASPWRELRFSIVPPQSYRYDFHSEGAGSTAKATITAQGDLDGDGQPSLYSITITPDESLTAQVGQMSKQDPEE
jgi:type IV pilus assembly protein PilA